MATTIISKLNRKLVFSTAARHRYASPHRLGPGIAIHSETERLKKASSESNINLVESNFDEVCQQQRRFYGTG